MIRAIFLLSRSEAYRGITLKTAAYDVVGWRLMLLASGASGAQLEQKALL
jgi:hypothetical protein